jgi:hypothetical protein
MEGVSVKLGVSDGWTVKVREGVKDGVSVAGWNNVGVRVVVPVMDGVKVGVNVFVAVPVRVGGVGVKVAVSVSVTVGVTDGVKLPGEGRSAIAINPIQ